MPSSIRKLLVAMLLVACGQGATPPAPPVSTPPAPPVSTTRPPPVTPAPIPADSRPPDAAETTPTPPSVPDPHDPNCSARPDGWCAAPAGDPCGDHHDVASCKADKRCGGIPYTGESVVACKRDPRGFGINCPTVGCVSLGKT